jgi:ElaB/YqjD/DUF883 family membrane-anchored ribosome-binding protein
MLDGSKDSNSKINGVGSQYNGKFQSPDSHLENITRDMGEKIGSMASSFADKANRYAVTGKSYIRENPVRSVAIACAAGVVTGGLLSLAMRRRK